MKLADAFNTEDLFQEVADLAREQGVTSQEDWDDVVEEVLEDHQNLGEIDLDDDIEGMKETLSDKWGEYKRKSGIEQTGPEEDLAPEEKMGKLDEEEAM